VRRFLLAASLAIAACGAAHAQTTATKPTPTAAVDERALFARATTATELARITRPTARSLANAKVVRGQFVQQRHLAGLKHPLESSGVFVFAREAGIEWHTLAPFDSQFLLGPTGITQRDEGAETLHIDTSEQPAMQVVARVFLALFALDVEALSHDFELYGAENGAGRWVIGLKPRAEALGSVFRHAIVRGGASVESVMLEDGNGDRSEILLRAVVYDPTGMTTPERQRFSSAP
jgi:hypothetical protein